jgi:hypothetical protein
VVIDESHHSGYEHDDVVPLRVPVAVVPTVRVPTTQLASGPTGFLGLVLSLPHAAATSATPTTETTPNVDFTEYVLWLGVPEDATYLASVTPTASGA